MPNPNDISSYEFQGNPFMEIVQRGQQQAPQGSAGTQQGQQSNPQQAMMQGGMMGSKGVEMSEDQLSPGQTGDSSRDLVGAISSLENFIKRSVNRDAIATARQIVLLIARLVHTDQQEQMDKLSGSADGQSPVL